MSLSPFDVQKLYVAYLGRPADPQGLSFWTNPSVNITLNEAASMFSSAPEFGPLHGDNSTNSIIMQTYRFLFNKAPDPAGLNYWFNAVEISHTIPKSILPLAIANGSSLYDGQVAYSKYMAASQFTNHIDTTAEIINYPTAAGEQVGRDFLGTISAYSYPSAAEIDNWIKKIPGAGFAAAQHFEQDQFVFADVAQNADMGPHQNQQHDVADGHISLIGLQDKGLLETVY